MAIAVDTNTLTSMISTLVDLSMDGRVPDPIQQECLVLSKRLRGTLVNLLSARFNDGTPAVVTANRALNSANAQVQALINNLNSAANTVAAVTNIVGQLDGLLKIAASFV